MQKQVVLEVLEQINLNIKAPLGSLTHVFQLDGTAVKSFMEIHQDCRVLVVSSSKKFKGIGGLDQFVDAI